MAFRLVEFLVPERVKNMRMFFSRDYKALVALDKAQITANVM